MSFFSALISFMNRHSFLCNIALILASVLTCNVQAEEANVASKVSFSEQVAPILLKRCVSCHGSKLAESGYRLIPTALC